MKHLVERRQRVTRELSEYKADALIVSGLANVRYLSGFTGSNALLLIGKEFSATLSKRECFVAARLHLADHEDPKCKYEDERR